MKFFVNNKDTIMDEASKETQNDNTISLVNIDFNEKYKSIKAYQLIALATLSTYCANIQKS